MLWFRKQSILKPSLTPSLIFKVALLCYLSYTESAPLESRVDQAQLELGEEEVREGNIIPGEDGARFTAQSNRFGYKIIDKYGNKQIREEEADAYNNRKGYYSFIDHNGKHRKVEYVADRHGFHATIKTNEPGTAPSHPAGAQTIAHSQNQVAPESNRWSFIETPTRPSPTTTRPVAEPHSVSEGHDGISTHRASIAHIAHAGKTIAVTMPLEVITPRRSAPALERKKDVDIRPVSLFVPGHASLRSHSGSVSHYSFKW
ncbi:uncharacterized protein LOC114828205 [Galendromus occidentalis]|uniref:Uncharacterized protein LOC114828205 n=1 Tax=Galendromus occidentalis TaxID=34638 RepID=A0AAJ7WHM4_9ACAR|nr:uncharacterized protein LOC114828205 [Galendromus occidentalis]